MAKLRFCPVTSEIRSLLAEGRQPEAVALAVERLRAGYTSPEFLAVVADLLAPPARKRGGQGRRTPHWYEIGAAYFDLRDAGLTYERAVLDVASRFSRAERTVERIVAEHERARGTANE